MAPSRRTLLQRGNRFDKLRAQLLRRERVLTQAGEANDRVLIQDAKLPRDLYQRLVTEARTIWFAKDTA